MKSLEVQTPGLAWVQTVFNLVPQWTVEPNPQVIEQTIQSLLPSSTVKVTFLAEGALNKLYDVKIDNEVFVMRVTLPVDPYYKTMSEVSTVDWISRTTYIPIPRIITYQPSRENPIGFEWIIMTKMPGRPLEELWRSLSFSAKASLVGEFAAFSSCLFRKQFQGIGNLYERESILNVSGLPEATWPAVNSAYSNISHLPGKGHMPAGLPDVGRIVSMHFFWGSHILQDVHRGPFKSSSDWITSHLSLSERDCQSTLDNLPSSDLESDDEEDAGDAIRTLGIIGKLKALLPSIFPPYGSAPEPSVLVHDDLSGRNILVHDNGELAAILDWECVSALPLWKACYYPAFLQGPPRCREPDLGRYKLDANGEAADLYWEHLWEYEVTLLRDVFIHKMESLEPGWVEVFHKSQRQRDFDLAVRNCDNEFVARHIRAWINDLAAGVDNLRSLRDRIDQD
ncbi:phosphotransferase enzyme family-domain-containing protein [Aspergillus pseudotamarii]|uniref:non-specific serine/threonine protein kinase n=1 Tax=Aspergillus pseudotamarii TaxID=132259 RepID=A0A5N6T4Q0_ASPPS|nr:phosphotransferase enzyme family-domain-containing protein [Aspergillus pseudotamarii]KAE8141294.1 phosphotransferase enzyme family-domain-containing protein [Aspergillus pseudotamarii]